MIVLVVSDLHLGKGRFLKNGQPNIMEDFEHDDLFEEFINYHMQGEFKESEVHLVLNGDIFNLMQIDIDGVFTPFINEERTVRALQKIAEGHRNFFQSLRRFLATPHKKISYVIGNHDAGMHWKKVQQEFMHIVQGEVHFCFNMKVHGVYIEHGHRFEAINTVPHKYYFVDGPNGQEILNLPWGSLFCVCILPQLKKYRPYMDKVRPLSLYIRWCLLHDFSFFVHMAKIVIAFILETLWKQWMVQKSVLTTVKLLKQITIYPRYEKQAKRILHNDASIQLVIMGHTHLREWRRFPEDKYYFNSGTWTRIPTMNSALHEDEQGLNYIRVEFDKNNHFILKASMNAWKGEWRPFREDIGVLPTSTSM